MVVALEKAKTLIKSYLSEALEDSRYEILFLYYLKDSSLFFRVSYICLFCEECFSVVVKVPVEIFVLPVEIFEFKLEKLCTGLIEEFEERVDERCYHRR